MNKGLKRLEKMLKAWLPDNWINDAGQIYPIELDGRALTHLFDALRDAIREDQCKHVQPWINE